MRKIIGIILGLVVVGLLIFMTFSVIEGNKNATDFNNYDFYSIIEPNKDNGNIGDHVKGSSGAPVVIFEYADFQCSGCASVNPRVNKLVEEFDGKLAVVFRAFLLDYHQNATAASSAAEAAGLQGYWKEYSDTLFNNQSEWFYATGSERTNYFKNYFEIASEGKGDMNKFLEDIQSSAVAKKISFDMGIGKRIEVSGTPAFYIDGQLIDWGSQKGGSVEINGKVITWDKAQGAEADFMNLMRRIIQTKLGE